MAKLPAPVHATAAAIYRAYEAQAGDGLRPHLGASEIGHACDRALWLSFRWAERAQFDGRMLRLFETGKREEDRVAANLRAIGCQVHTHDADGQQWRVSAVGGHFGGSMDGAVVGLPEAPKAWHVWECKTANDKTWKELAQKGVLTAQPRHYAQMQVYMHLNSIDRALYTSVNKNTDEIHAERVALDRQIAEQLIDRARRIITADAPPARISDDPAWFQCKGCRFHAHCHGTAAPLVNCRTCMHATPQMDGDGRWTCEAHREEITVNEQREGCDDHRYVPLMLAQFAEPVDADEATNAVIYRNRITGAQFVNADAPGLTSAEIRACADKAMLGQECADDTLRQLRAEFGATHAAE
jgi:hypothetical protein